METRKSFQEGRTRLTMKGLAKSLQPREKLLRFGPELLTDSELIAIILRTGTQEETVLEMSNRLILTLSEKDMLNSGLNCLKNANLQDFMEIKGIGKTKASQLIAIMEISKRINSKSLEDVDQITSPRIAAEIFMNKLRHETIEQFYVVGLDTKKRIQFVDCISKGTIDCTIVHPREVYSRAISRKSHCIMLLHNHPTGIVEPSKEDIRLTNRLKEVGSIVGIPVVDHIIIGDGLYFSFLEEGLIG